MQIGRNIKDIKPIDDIGQEAMDHLTNWLDTTHQEWVEEPGSTNVLLIMAVENLLQGFGVEGYEWS